MPIKQNKKVAIVLLKKEGGSCAAGKIKMTLVLLKRKVALVLLEKRMVALVLLKKRLLLCC